MSTTLVGVGTYTDIAVSKFAPDWVVFYNDSKLIMLAIEYSYISFTINNEQQPRPSNRFGGGDMFRQPIYVGSSC
jgi:hypothetical protein